MSQTTTIIRQMQTCTTSDIMNGPPSYEAAMFEKQDIKPFAAEKPVTVQAYPEMTKDSARKAQEDTLTQTSSASSSTLTRRDWKPVVIPQTTVRRTLDAFSCPFVRAYAPQLAEIGIDAATFTKQIDEINEAFVGSPVFQVISLAGTITSCVGEPITSIVGASLSVASGVASAAVSYARTKAYVKDINRRVFLPQGLRMRIVSTKVLLKECLEPGHDLADSAGKLKLPPLEQKMDEFDADGFDASDDSSDGSSIAEIDPLMDRRMRRLHALEGHIAPLTFDVPAQEMPENVLRKIGAWRAKKREARLGKKARKDCHKVEKESAKKQKKVFKRRLSVQEASHTVADRETRLRTLMASGGNVKRQGKAMDKLQDAKKDLHKAQQKLDEAREKPTKKAGKIEKRDQKAAQKIRWLVIVREDDATGVAESAAGESDVDLGLQETASTASTAA